MHHQMLAAKTAELHPHIRVLHISGYSELGISAKGLVEPGLEFLPKPFSHRSLIRKVHDILAEPAAKKVSARASRPARSHTGWRNSWFRPWH